MLFQFLSCPTSYSQTIMPRASHGLPFAILHLSTHQTNREGKEQMNEGMMEELNIVVCYLSRGETTDTEGEDTAFLFGSGHGRRSPSTL
jgi:hypothetical protein